MKQKPKQRPAAPGVTARRKWKQKFLEHLAECGNVKFAVEAAGVSRAAAYKHREKDQEFAAKWDEAMDTAADVIELEVRRRAVEGVQEPVIHQGKLCGVWVNDKGETVTENTPGAKLIPLTVTKYSDNLLIFYMKAFKPEKYRDTHHHTHDGNVGIIRTATEGEAAAAQLLDELRQRLGVDGAAA